MRLLNRLWIDEAGFVVSSELVLIATILVLGLITGLTSLRNSVVQELADVGAAIGNISQSYSFSAITAHTSSSAGSAYTDVADQCENGGTTGQSGELCIQINPAGVLVTGEGG